MRAQTLDITLRVRASLPLIVAMPVWTPGAYRRRDWLRNVSPQGGRTADGRPLRWQREGVAGWRIEVATEAGRPASQQRRRPAAAGPSRPGIPTGLVLRYRVSAQELADDASHVDDTHAHLNGTSVFLHLPQLAGAEHRVQLRLPRGWQLASALPRCTPTQPTCLLARDYHELVDSPIEAGRFRRHELTVAGRPITLVHHDGRGRRLPSRLLRDLARIISVQARWFGPLPYRRYLVILHTVPSRRFTALEHAASTSVVVPPTALAGSGEPYELLLYVLAHEHFHVFNGKRVRLAAHAPYDYLKPPRTRMLWWTEGVTDYFSLRTLRAAGLWNTAQYLAAVSHEIDRLRAAPERLHKSLAEVAYDAWLPSRDRSVGRISTYGKGQLVALLLDLELRRQSAPSTLLQLVQRLDRLASKAGGILALSRAKLLGEVKRAGGPKLAKQLVRWSETTSALPLERALGQIGLQLRRVLLPRARARLGFEARRRGGELEVIAVRRVATVARSLFVGDRILSIDGRRVRTRWRRGLTDGRRHRLVVQRRGGARERLRLRFAPQPRHVTLVTTAPVASATARARGARWLAPR